MTDWLKKSSQTCDRKGAYPRAEQADKAAKKASRKTGRLIISYKCYNCGAWHIGHADRSQQIVNKPIEPKPPAPDCIVCNATLSKRRRNLIDNLRKSGVVMSVTCCSRCQRRNHRLKREQERLAQANAPVDAG
jgi:hypothetical protein